MNQAAIDIRHNEVIEFLKAPKTLNEIAEKFQVSYYTARNDVAALIKRGLVSPSSQLGAGSSKMYIAGGTSEMPRVRVPAQGNASASLLTLAKAAANSVSVGIASEAATRYVLDVCLNLVFEASRAHREGFVPNPKTLADWRKNLVNAKMALDSQSAIASQLLAYSRLWDVNDLVNICNDSEFDHELVESLMSTYLTAKEQGHGQEGLANEAVAPEA